jgi:ABC-type glutathione transport system ATPase component
LSTITNADQILVLHAGKVAESGTHQDLLAMKGRYYNMWRKQIRAERAAEQASQALAKANALREAAMERPGSSGNEGSPSEDVSENEADNRSSATLVTHSLASQALVRAAEESLRDGSSSITNVDDNDDRADNAKPDHGTAGSEHSDDSDDSHFRELAGQVEPRKPDDRKGPDANPAEQS